MPLAVDSVGRLTFNYSITNINRVNASNRTAEVTQQEAVVESNNNNNNERINFLELPKEEVKSLFFNQQESQLTRDILNTFATNINDTQRSPFTFNNIDTFQRLIDERESQQEAEINNEYNEFLDERESQRRAEINNENNEFLDERESQRRAEIDNDNNEFLDERESQRRAEIDNDNNEF